MTNHTFRELKRLSREFLMGRYMTPVLAVITATILPGILLMPFSTSTMTHWNVQTATYAIAAIIIGLLAQLLNAGIVRIHLLLAKRQSVSLKDLFWAFRNQPDRFLLSALFMTIMFLLPAVPAGLYLLMLARKKMTAAYLVVTVAAVILLLSIILLYMACSFCLVFPFYIEHDDMSVIEGFRSSLRYMRGNKMRYFLLQLSFLGWQLLGLCSMGIGMLWISPYISQTQANFYLDLTSQLHQNTEPNISDFNETESSAQ